MAIPNKLLFRVFNRAASFFRDRDCVVAPAGSCSPHLQFCDRRHIEKCIREYRETHAGELSFIDIGGRRGEHCDLAERFKYTILDIDRATTEHEVIVGDICDCPQIPDGTFDIAFSNNLFEHLKFPWNAARECIRIVKDSGLLIHVAPFSWRYHPVPVDFYRYTHEGLAHLFEQDGLVERILSGYDITTRRKDRRGGKIKGGLDVPPVDELGGWREHWETVYIGRKR